MATNVSNKCYCDYEAPEFYSAAMRVARKRHPCGECGHSIAAGERYEYVAAKSDGGMWTARTCSRCLAVREYVQTHVPCFCWLHHSMLDDADDTIREYRHELPGMGMAYGRLRVAINRSGASRLGG